MSEKNEAEQDLSPPATGKWRGARLRVCAVLVLLACLWLGWLPIVPLWGAAILGCLGGVLGGWIWDAARPVIAGSPSGEKP